MKETEIRPDDLRSEGKRLYKIDQEKYFVKQKPFL